MELIILCVLLAGELLLSFFLFQKDISSPAVVFSAGFLFATLDLMTMADTWQVVLHWNTVFIVAGGVFLFIASSLVISILFPKRHTIASMQTPKRYIDSEILWLFLTANIGIVILVALKTASVVRRYGYSGDLLRLLGHYVEISKFTTEDVSIGSIASNLYTICKAETYIWGYYGVWEYLERKKTNVLVIANFLVCVLSNFLQGSRTGAVFAISALLPAFMFLKRDRGNNTISKKAWIIIIVAAAGLFFSFRAIASVLGREWKSVSSTWEYLAIYTGAPILNLDIFLQHPHSVPELWGYNTFQPAINYFSSRFGIEEWKHTFDLPFQNINGRQLGNVYTTFYAYIYDFGLKGYFTLVPLMAALSQFLFQKACCSQREQIPASRLLYMYFFPNIAFSFFSNKFYECFSFPLIKFLVIWLLLGWIVFRIHFYDRRKISFLNSNNSVECIKNEQ